MTTFRDKLTDIIEEAIRRHESNNGVKLQAEDFEFLKDTVVKFTDSMIYKYICGVKEHGPGFLSDVNFLDEALAETKDMVFYISGAIYKQRKYDKRYNHRNTKNIGSPTKESKSSNGATNA